VGALPIRDRAATDRRSAGVPRADLSAV